LTSNLDVPSGSNGITLTAPGVTLDLNGFAISSTYQCCASGGAGSGVDGAASRTTVVNGEIAGFAQRGLVLGSFSHVERVVVRQIGTHAIALGDGGVALSNRVTQVGQSGLLFTGVLPGVYRDNVLAGTALASGSTARAVAGVAHATGGSYCEDHSCSPRGTRRYYLSEGGYDGSEAIGACVPGFHFASMHEVRSTSVLEYDGLRPTSSLVNDSGVGGPGTFQTGWIRTGAASSGGVPGFVHCNLWTSGSSLEDGTIAHLNHLWATDPDASDRWVTGSIPCNSSQRVWCIED
jgi:hypothetical protein